MTSPRRTRIVATIGPATRDPDILGALLDAGVNVCRINGSHGNPESILADIARIRRVARNQKRHVAILLDLQGPKVRVGNLTRPVPLESGDALHIVLDDTFIPPGEPVSDEGADAPGSWHVGTTFPQLGHDVRPGEPVLFADGALTGTIESVQARDGEKPGEVVVRIDIGGPLGAHKGINLPSSDLSTPAITTKDLADLEAGIRAGIDYVALSFVRRPEDVIQLRDELDRLGSPTVPIIAKIEKPQAVARIDELLPVVDGLMVARGDLGVEMPLSQVPVVQKQLIDAANRAGVLVITATQMLDSMERNPRPTRAETTDVANAILDGTDALMLSGETAVGRYPVRAVEVMDRIACEVESSSYFTPRELEDLPALQGPLRTAIRAACHAVRETGWPLVVFSWSGQSARLASKTRPPGPIFALTPQSTVADQLALVWGVTPVRVPVIQSTDELIDAGERVLLERGLVSRGQQVVVLAGRAPTRGATDLVKVDTIGGG
ncbi:MAG: pyruvate kinase [Myxococcota bacterium]|nr:pyruvate kinase [Myxococcota bacterium]